MATHAKVYFQRADNARVATRGAMGGWDQLRSRLKGEEDIGGMVPMLYAFSTCEHTIRTVPALQHDERRPEDLNTNSEDHAADETRYACMARPWVREAPDAKPRKFDRTPDLTVEEIIAANRRRRRGEH
jgi:hypothetical protein